jgi:glycosyltransferase involved in cell wall biosynthesis
MTKNAAVPRVLMVSDVYFPRVNGVSTSIQTFRADLGNRNCHSELIAPAYPQAAAADPSIHRVRSRYVPLDPEDRMLVAADLLAKGRAIAANFDVIHIQTPFVAHKVGLRLAREFGLKSVESYHTYFEQYFHHYLPYVPRALLRVVARAVSRRQCDAVDAVIAPSAQMAQVLRDYGVQGRIEVIPTGLDTATFAGADRNRFRGVHGIDAMRPMMLHVGRVAFEKNIGFIIDVLAAVRREVPDVLLVIAGEGPALKSLVRQVQSRGLGGNVKFVGYLDRATALIDCYASANAFVFASNTETQGLVLLEALAAGTPVVSTAVMGTEAVLEGARGAVVVREDVAEFSAAVVNVLRDSRLQADLSRQGVEFVAQNWSSERMSERLLALYKDLLQAPRSMPQSTVFAHD